MHIWLAGVCVIEFNYWSEHLIKLLEVCDYPYTDTAALDWTRLIQHVETVCLHPEHYCVSCREMNSFDQNSPHLVLVEGTQVLSARYVKCVEPAVDGGFAIVWCSFLFSF